MSHALQRALVSSILPVIKIRIHTGIQLVGDIARMRTRSVGGTRVAVAAASHGIMASPVVHVGVNAGVQLVGDVGVVRASRRG